MLNLSGDFGGMGGTTGPSIAWTLIGGGLTFAKYIPFGNSKLGLTTIESRLLHVSMLCDRLSASCEKIFFTFATTAVQVVSSAGSRSLHFSYG